MKKGLIVLAALSFIGSSILFSNAHRDTHIVNADSTYVEGYYARTGSDTTKSNLYFYMEENDAPFNNDSSVKYQPLSRDAIILKKENGEQKLLPAEYVETIDVFTKYTATKYYLDNSIFNDNGGLDIGDTIILNGGFYNPANDTVLHIKESKFFIDSDQAVTTLPHQVNNITSYINNSVASVTVDGKHDWACMFWAPTSMNFTVMPMTTHDKGYYATSAENLYINGEPKAKLNVDLIKRRDNWGTEIYVNLNDQTGSHNTDVGTVIVLNGLFTYKDFVNGEFPKNPTIDLDPGEYFGIEIDLFAALKTGTGSDDYQVLDFKQYLKDNFEDLYDYDLYDPNDYYDLRQIKKNLEAEIETRNTPKELYETYNAAIEAADQLTLTADGFDIYKNKKIAELENYVSLDKYFEDEQATITNYLNTAISGINAATTSEQISVILLDTKSKIDKVPTRVNIMEDAVLNKADGYEEYLESYDEVTLNDLSLGESQTFHGLISERDGEINTNDADKEQINSFVPNKENTKGNVVFNFCYQSDCIPSEGGNLTIVLRGIRYYGYKFVLGTDSQGLYYGETIPGKTTDFIQGFSNVFTDTTKQYAVSVAVIDLIEGNRSWVTITIDGITIYNIITDSISFCNNARVSLSNNGNPYSDEEGTTTISNYYPASETKEPSSIYGGIFKYESGHSDITSNLYLSLDENNVAYDINKSLGSYATKPSNIKLMRDSTTYEIAKTDIPVIAKYGPNSYQLYLSQLFNETITEVIDGDKVIISGLFTYFDSKTNEKVAYEIINSVLVYDEENTRWNSEVSLADYKQDIINRIYRCADEEFLAGYDRGEQKVITSLVSQYLDSVEDATTVDAVKELYATFQDAVGGVITKLEKYRKNKTYAIQEYLIDQSRDYYPNDWLQIMRIKHSAIDELQGAASFEEIDSIYRYAIQEMDAILTIEEHKTEDLSNAKQKAITEVKNHYASLNIDSMSDNELAELNVDTLQTIEEIKAAESIEQINQILSEYKARHKLPTKKVDTKGCGGSVYTTSILLSAISLLGIALMTYKKRKHVLEEY